MSQYIDAFYNDGVFRPRQPVDLAEGAPVKVLLGSSVQHDSEDDLSAVADLIDHEFTEECRRNAGKALPIEEIQRRLSVIKDSLSDSIIEEREDRF